MNSQIKDALSEFISSNSSAIEKAMENEGHDITKSEPTIPDLVNYLSCPTPQPSHKDGQHISLEDKASAHNPTFNSVNMHAPQQSQYGSSQQHPVADNAQLNNVHVGNPAAEPSAGISQNQVPPVSHANQQQQQQFLQHHDSYGQSTSMYADSSGNNTNPVVYQDSQHVNSSAFDHSSGQQSGQSVPNGTPGEGHFYQKDQSAQYQMPAGNDSNKQYQQSLQPQYNNSENVTGQFPNQSQSSASAFQDSSVLTSSFPPSHNNQLHYNSPQNGLDFGMMDVNQSTLNSIETDTSQFKSPEKMHVDEPEVIYHQNNTNNSIGQYQQVFQSQSSTGDTSASSGAHVQAYSADGFHQQSSGVPGNNYGVDDSGFKQPLTSPQTSHSSAEFTAAGVSSNAAQAPGSFEMSTEQYPPSSAPSPFNGQNLQQSSSASQPLPQVSASSDFLVQQSPVQPSSAGLESSLYTSPQPHVVSRPGTGSFSVPSSPCPNQPDFGNSQNNPYHSNQYQPLSVPTLSHPSPGVPDSFQTPGNSPAPSSFGQQHQLSHQGNVDAGQYQQSPSSHQPSPADHSQFQQSPLVASDYNGDATLVQSPGPQSAGYQNSVASPANNAVPYSSSAQASGGLQQHSFINPSLSQTSASVDDSTNFAGYDSNEISLHPPGMNDAAGHASSLQTSTNYGVSSSVSQDMNTSLNTPSDSSAVGFASGEGLQSTSHTSFTDVGDSFPQLDLEAVVNTFHEDSSTTGIQQNAPDINTSSNNANYGSYQYTDNNARASTSYPGTSESVTDVNAPAGLPYSYVHQEQQSMSMAVSGSYVATQSTSTFASGTPNQSAGQQYGSSNFGMPPTSQAVSESYPQPMQVQDAISDPSSSYTYQTSNAGTGMGNLSETAMDTSSGLGEKSNDMSTGITYEEIHMSIVKAGDVLSKKTANAEHVNQHSLYDSSVSQTSDVKIHGTPSSLTQPVYSSQPPGFAQDNQPHSSVNHHAASQAPVLTSASSMQQQDTGDTFTQAGSYHGNSSMSNISVDHRIISSLLGGLQASSSAPSSQLLMQDQLKKPVAVTVPNFLENPGAVVSCIRSSNPDNVSLIPSAKITPGQPHTRFVVTMIAASPANSRPVVASSGMNQPKLAVMPSAGISTSQQQILTPAVTLATSLQTNPQILNSVVNMPLSSSSVITTSVFGQASLNAVNLNNVHQTNGLPQASTFSSAPILGSVPGSGVFLQVAPQQLDSKPQLLPSIAAPASKLATESVKPALGGMTTVFIPAGNLSGGLNNTSGSQPHIILSLEDLQKLLAQQNLSQPTTQTQQAQSALQQQQQQLPPVTSPQTLVLQKPGSQPLRQNPPRLLIKGGGLPNPPRLMHPHQQLQQTREKLQLLVHQTHQSQTVPSGVLSHRSQEHTIISATQDGQQKTQTSFQLLSIQRDQQQQQTQHKLQMSEQTQIIEQQQQPKIQLQMKQTQVLQQHQQQQTVQNLFIQQLPKTSDQGLPGMQMLGQQQQQQLVLPQTHQQQAPSEQKPFVQIEPQLQQQLQEAQNVIQLAQMQLELQQLQKQQEEEQKQEEQNLKQFQAQHQQQLQPAGSERTERHDRQVSDSLKRDYKHLHSLLTGDSSVTSSASTVVTPSAKTPSLPGHGVLQLPSGSGTLVSSSVTPTSTVWGSFPASAAPLSFLSQSSSAATSLPSSAVFGQRFNSGSTAQFGSTALSAGSSEASDNLVSSAPLSTFVFTKTFNSTSFSTPTDSKEVKEEELKFESLSSSSLSKSLLSQHSTKTENESTDKTDPDSQTDISSGHQASILAQILTENKRAHTPLSVDLSSPANSNSEAPSPLSSPSPIEDGNTQLTLIERSADLHIKSDTMQGMDDDDDENATFFDLNAFHKRPSADEVNSSGDKNESVPVKIAKPSLDSDARSSVRTPSSPEPTFDIGSVVSSASNFSFAFGKKEENAAEVFTFGSSGTSTTTTDTLPSTSKSSTKASGMRATVPTQPVRPTSRKQKEHSLKAYYSSKFENMELKILEQPEPQHRARYQTEGSRGAIKDVSQQGFPVIKLFGYNKATKLQVFIGDECGRVKPHGFYQACRVFGKNSTACVEQEIEGTTVIEIEMLPENDMTVKLDCIGILKLRNADVERRIGPKRARDKKKTNTRARLVTRCLVDKPDGSQHVLQVVSNPIVCTQPVGQPEISRMSLSECSVEGGECLFIIGKNFKNKGTSVLFQATDGNEDTVLWQAEAEIEQEFFQPTHLICKVPPYKDKTVESPQMAQIVVSCAGKKSDPQKFVYKPVYQLSPPVKQEVPMETDAAQSSRPMPFVSPEALQLNRMVHQTHAQSSSSSSMFQLPPGTLPAIQTSTVKSPPTPAASTLIKPAKLFGQSISQPVVAAVSPAAAVSPLPAGPAGSASAGSSHVPASQTGTGTTLPTFLLEERSDGLVAKSQPDPSLLNTFPVVSASTSLAIGTTVNCIVHSDSKIKPVNQISYATSSNHLQPSLTASGSSGGISQPVSHVGASSQIPSRPFFVVVDPSALQADSGGDKIQQLLQQILEAQSKVW